MAKKQEMFEGSFFANPVVGTVFTVLSALSFLVLAMTLSLVGQAAVVTEYAQKNYYTFMGILIIAFVLALCAVISKLERRKLDNSPLPYSSIGLCGICVFLFIALITGLLGV